MPAAALMTPEQRQAAQMALITLADPGAVSAPLSFDSSTIAGNRKQINQAEAEHRAKVEKLSRVIAEAMAL